MPEYLDRLLDLKKLAAEMEPAGTTPQTDAATLSICIPTYNRVCHLDNLFGELTAQTDGLRRSYELLIGGNCSSDTTKQVVTKYQDRLNIRYFRRPSNLGSAENLNQFYRSTQGKYVLYHTDDDLPVLAEINKDLEIFERNAVVGVIFAPWFVHDLPTRQDITPFYRQNDNYLIEQHDYAKLLALILSHHIFPEIYLTRRRVSDRLHFATLEHAFWAFARTTEVLGSYALYFNKTPFYRSVARYLDDEIHTQAGNEEVKYVRDRYRGGLEYMLDKFAPTLTPGKWQEWLNVINQFVFARMKVALCLRTQEGDHQIGNYYTVNRIKALGEVGDLSVPYDLYHVNATFEYVVRLNPLELGPPRYATLCRAPLQALHHTYGFTDTELMVLDDDVTIPHHTVVVTPTPMDIAVPAGREVRFVSELETLTKFPRITGHTHMDLSNTHSVVSLMNNVLAPTNAIDGSTASDGAGRPSVDFGFMLKPLLDRIDASQQKAKSISRSFGMGNNDVDLHDVILSLQKASIDMQAAVQVRNKLISAYQSIMNMSI